MELYSVVFCRNRNIPALSWFKMTISVPLIASNSSIIPYIWYRSPYYLWVELSTLSPRNLNCCTTSLRQPALTPCGSGIFLSHSCSWNYGVFIGSGNLLCLLSSPHTPHHSPSFFHPTFLRTQCPDILQDAGLLPLDLYVSPDMYHFYNLIV